jgi:hypothetical protein
LPLKKVVVVVGHGMDNVYFSGKDLQLFNKIDVNVHALIVADEYERGKRKELGVFNDWLYWKDISEEAPKTVIGKCK